MEFKNLHDTNIKNKTVLYCAPYDIDTKEIDGRIVLKDNYRIRATVPSIKYLLEQNCKIVILTWVKRPNGEIVEKWRTIPHAKELTKLLGKEVKHVSDCIGVSVENAVKEMSNGEIIMLENSRFYAEEKENDENFISDLTKYYDIAVFDNFAGAHRDEASTTGVLRSLPSVAGLYFEKEVESLEKALNSKQHPFVLVVGGVKAEDKVKIIDRFLGKADTILVGGKLPLDPSVENFKHEQSVKVATLRNDTLDISDESIEIFVSILQQARTVIWAGPMGYFENLDSAKGTIEIGKAIANIEDGYTVVGGGDTSDAVYKLGLENGFDFISLAGGATLNFLGGEELPVMKYLIKDD